MYQHPGLSQPGYGLRAQRLRGLREAAHLGLRAVLGAQGAKLLLGRALESCEA